jgi:fibro-slime domain-containing protein
MDFKLSFWDGGGWGQIGAAPLHGSPNSRQVYMFPSKKIKNICISCYNWAPLKNHFGIKEVEVYATADTGGPGIDTAQIGNFDVTWEIEKNNDHIYSLRTTAYQPNSKVTNLYKTRLNQKLTVSAVDIVNPYGLTVDAPVTYYDFHSDRSNPEFEQMHPFPGGLIPIKNMVAFDLDSQLKPVLGSNPYFNYYIQYWFRSSNTIPLDDSVSRYPTSYGKMECGMDYSWPGVPAPNGTRLSANAAFENIKFNSVITFNHIGNGLYEIDDPEFFPIDSLGFGCEWNKYRGCGDLITSHNFSYTMEMHRTFVKVPGQVFRFRGDDDVWLFINNQLVMDLGGMHAPVSDSVLIDSLTSLDYNHTYTFDFFYCERNSPGASIFIQTNMLTALITQEKRSWRRNYGAID